MPITINTTNITFNDGTVQSTAAGGAAGFNTVGSYCFVQTNADFQSINPGSNYSAGGVGPGQLMATTFRNDTFPSAADFGRISGTWRWMAGNTAGINIIGIAVRVS